MISLTEQTSENGPIASAPLPEQRASAGAPLPNGTAPSQLASDAAAAPAAADRAEEMVDRFAHQVGYLAAFATRKVASFASRARESLQDFWADVQDFRHGKKP